jgi:hypothetical protein
VCIRGYICRSPPPACQYTGGVPPPPPRREWRRGSAARDGCWARTEFEVVIKVLDDFPLYEYDKSLPSKILLICFIGTVAWDFVLGICIDGQVRLVCLQMDNFHLFLRKQTVNGFSKIARGSIIH